MWASPADRDRSLEVVKASFAEGRLTMEELDLRVGQVLVSRYFEELMALTGDLPAGPSAGCLRIGSPPRLRGGSTRRRWLWCSAG